MEDTQNQVKEADGIYFSLLENSGGKDVKLTLGLAELIFQALILLLLV